MPVEDAEVYRSLGERIELAVLRCGDQIEDETWKFDSDSESESEEEVEQVS